MSATANSTTKRREKNKDRMMQQSQIYQMFADLQNELITAIQSGNADRDAKIDQNALQLANIQQAVAGLETTHKNTMIRVKILEKHENELLQKVQMLEGNVEELCNKLNDLQERERRQSYNLDHLQRRECDCNLPVLGYRETPHRRDLTAVLQAFFFVAWKRLK